MRWVLILVTCVSVTGAAAAAEDASVTSSSAFTIAAGYGPSYGGIGGQIGFAQQLPEIPLRLIPFFGLGYLFTADSTEGFGGDTHLGLAGGLAVCFGVQHRFLLEATYGAFGATTAYLRGNVAASRSLYGVIFTGGYEYLFKWGFFGRIQAGAGVLVDLPPLLADERWKAAFDVGVGYKLW